MPTIIYDQQCFKMQQYGGVSRYFSELISRIKNSKDCDVLPSSYFSNNHHLREEQTTSYNFIYRLGKFKGKERLIQYLSEKQDQRIRKLIATGKYDIFHPTFYEGEFLSHLPKGKPFVLTVHDMIHELFFDSYFNQVQPITKLKSILIPKAAHIIAISQNTKKNILTFYPDIEPEKISVIYHGYSAPKKSSNQTKSATKYILYVGTREYYKNFSWLVTAIAGFLKEEGFLLVCAGGSDFTASEKVLIEQCDLDGKVQYQKVLNDRFLNELYQHAFCFVFPSLFEGFGLPILEAFANSCPVILANTSCFPEIAENAALYFEPDDPNTLINQLTKLLYQGELKRFLINSAFERLKDFGWDKMAKQHEEVYNALSK